MRKSLPFVPKWDKSLATLTKLGAEEDSESEIDDLRGSRAAN